MKIQLTSMSGSSFVCFFFFILLNRASIFSGSSDASESESEELESDESDEELESESDEFPAFKVPVFKKSRKLSVSAPRPIEVKKLIANRVFFGLSFGNRPSKNTCIVSSCNRVFN